MLLVALLVYVALVLLLRFVANVLWRLHMTQVFVDINQAYYVVHSYLCKKHLLQQETWRAFDRSPARLGRVASLMVMHVYGFYHVGDYEPLYQPLAHGDEWHLYEYGHAGDLMLVFKGMSRTFEYYQVLAQDGLDQQSVWTRSITEMRVFRRWWRMVEELMDGDLGAFLTQRLEGGARLWVFGFSRGGVLAEYVAYHLRRWAPQVGVCTLGKPMSGDRTWSKTLDAFYRPPEVMEGEGDETLLGRNVRCAVIGDPIVNLPWANFADKRAGWYPTQATTALWLEHRETDYLWKYHTLKTYFEALQQKVADAEKKSDTASFQSGVENGAQTNTPQRPAPPNPPQGRLQARRVPDDAAQGRHPLDHQPFPGQQGDPQLAQVAVARAPQSALVA